MNKQRPFGQEPVSLATVAAQAGVSIATVSRIVNGETRRASAETVERVQKLVAALGYRPNHVGRTLRRRESRIVAMLSPNLDNPAMAAIAASVETALRSAGYVMILCDTHDRAELQDEYLHGHAVAGRAGICGRQCGAQRSAVRLGCPGRPHRVRRPPKPRRRRLLRGDRQSARRGRCG